MDAFTIETVEADSRTGHSDQAPPVCSTLHTGLRASRKSPVRTSVINSIAGPSDGESEPAAGSVESMATAVESFGQRTMRLLGHLRELTEVQAELFALENCRPDVRKKREAKVRELERDDSSSDTPSSAGKTTTSQCLDLLKALSLDRESCVTMARPRCKPGAPGRGNGVATREHVEAAASVNRGMKRKRSLSVHARISRLETAMVGVTGATAFGPVQEMQEHNEAAKETEDVAIDRHNRRILRLAVRLAAAKEWAAACYPQSECEFWPSLPVIRPSRAELRAKGISANHPLTSSPVVLRSDYDSALERGRARFPSVSGSSLVSGRARLPSVSGSSLVSERARFPSVSGSSLVSERARFPSVSVSGSSLVSDPETEDWQSDPEMPVIVSRILACKKEIDAAGTGSGSACQVCFQRPRHVVLVPCAHAQYCLDCTRKVVGKNQTCTTCGEFITSFVDLTG